MTMGTSIKSLPPWIVAILLLALPPADDSTRAMDGQATPAQAGDKAPALTVPDVVQPFVDQVEPGKDAFPLEGQVRELEARLGELSAG